MASAPDPILYDAAVFLGSTVAAVLAFKRIGLGSILGYIAAGFAIGPQGLGLIDDGPGIAHVGEFGVVLLLFVIGLEMQVDRLWRLRAEIFGLGALQVGLTGALLAAGLWLAGLRAAGALVAGLALALSSTAFGVQIMRERGEFAAPWGRRAFAVLLFQDLAVAPLLALAAFLAPFGGGDPSLRGVAAGLLAIAAVMLLGRFGVPALFRLIAFARAEEAFTASALLVVALSALAMQWAGLSMALGAFLAGVLLSETEFRHQLETDLEPFRALFLGLFFVAVGMTADWALAAREWVTVGGGALALFAAKAVLLHELARRSGSTPREARRIAVTLGQAGEFAFVLLALAADTWLVDRTQGALLTAVVGSSMALTPLAARLLDLWEARRARAAPETLAGLPEGRRAPIIVAGFGRSGQVIARILRMRGYDLTLIDNSPTRIRMAARIGDKVFFGDGSRLDVLSMAGAGEAKAIFLCINDRAGASKAVSRLRERFPGTPVLAMTYDRFSEIEMREAGADEVIRETFESAVELARRGLQHIGDDRDLDALIEEFRRRDEEMMRLQIEHGLTEGVLKAREKYEIDRA
jgi:monovalent cation:proton antiporter-2 (CPA2) family protein